MPIFVGRSAGLITQPSTHQLKFRSPVPRNPMLIPSFIERETAPLHHTHSQGDVTGKGANASAAGRALFISIGPVTSSPPGGTGQSLKAYFEVRNGLSARASERWLIEAWTGSSDPPIRPSAAALSAATVDTGTFFDSILGAPDRSKDFLLMTTVSGSAIVAYADTNDATVFLAANLIGPRVPGGGMLLVD